MLLKDFKIEKYYIDMGNPDGKQTVRIVLSSDVIIKRDGKLYAVPYVKMIEEKIDKYNADVLEIFLFSYRLEVDKISKLWKISDKELEDGMGFKFIAEKPFEI